MALPMEHKTAKTISGDTTTTAVASAVSTAPPAVAPAVSTAGASADWCPRDDGIKIVLPGKAKAVTTKEDVDAHIQTVLYGPGVKRRLPVFMKFCPEN